MANIRIKSIYTFPLIGLFTIAALFFINDAAHQTAEIYINLPQTAALIDSTERKKDPIVLMFVGDIMLDRGVEYVIKKQGQEDFEWPFLKIADYLNKADILFGNLESLVSDKGIKVGSVYSFRADPKAIEGLACAGFDVLSVANNHIFDYSREAMEDSFKRLEMAGIDYIGGGFSEKEAHSPVIKEVKGIKIAYLAYTNIGSEYWVAKESQSGIAWLDNAIADDIKTAKEKADLVVVSMHFGEEY